MLVMRHLLCCQGCSNHKETVSYHRRVALNVNLGLLGGDECEMTGQVFFVGSRNLMLSPVSTLNSGSRAVTLQPQRYSRPVPIIRRATSGGDGPETNPYGDDPILICWSVSHPTLNTLLIVELTVFSGGTRTRSLSQHVLFHRATLTMLPRDKGSSLRCSRFVKATFLHSRLLLEWRCRPVGGKGGCRETRVPGCQGVVRRTQDWS